MVAIAARGRLELVDLAACRSRVLADTNAADVRFSADGRWLAYSRQVRYIGTASTSPGLFVVSVLGGPERSPLGAGVTAWSWSPKGDLLYGITAGGSLVSASPTGGRRVIATHLASGRFGVAPTGLGISSNGERAFVDRSRCGRQSVGELDTVDLHTGARTVAVRERRMPLIFAGISPDGQWLLFWPDPQCAVSLNADGVPLEAVPATGGRPVTAVRHMLHYRDFLTWCDGQLIAAASSSRQTGTGSGLVQTAPSTWRQRTIRRAGPLSWVSPSCGPSGHALAAAAGPNNAPVSFGREHRSIWLLRRDGHPIRRLTSPPAPDLSDEAPRFARDGSWIMFIRTRVVPIGQSAISKDTIELTRANATTSAIPIARFTSSDSSYYDHFDWPDEIDWYQPH